MLIIRTLAFLAILARVDSGLNIGGRMKVRFAITAACLLLAGWICTGHAQGSGSKPAVLNDAAAALGGAERIRAVKNIKLVGYAQYAYQIGGGNIDGSPHAPQKYQAANDLTRVYDLQNNRWQATERRNFLFPFAAPFGHSFAPMNLILDGDIAYDIAPDGKVGAYSAMGRRRAAPGWPAHATHVDGEQSCRRRAHGIGSGDQGRQARVAKASSPSSI